MERVPSIGGGEKVRLSRPWCDTTVSIEAEIEGKTEE